MLERVGGVGMSVKHKSERQSWERASSLGVSDGV